MTDHAAHLHSGDLSSAQRRLRRAQHILALSINRFAAIAMLAVATAALLFPVPQVNAVRPLAVAAWAVGALALIALVIRRTETQPQRSRRTWLGPAGACCLAVATAAAAALTGALLSFSYGWDAASVMEAALPLARGTDPTAAHLDYFSRHDNNLLLLVFDTALVRLADVLSLPVSTLVALANGACAGIMSLCTYALASRFTRPALAMSAQVLLLVFIGFSPWNAVPYTDLPLAALVSLSLALALTVRVTPAWLDWIMLALAAGALALAILLKPTAWIVVIAAAAAVLLDRFEIRPVRPGRVKRPDPEHPPDRTAFDRLIRGLGFLVTTVLLVTLVLPQVVLAASGLSASELDPDRKFPSIHFVRIGMETRFEERDGLPIAVYGAWSEQAQNEMMQAESEADRVRLSGEAVSSRLADLGVGGYLDFIGKKAVMTWGDASFFSWQEGTDRAQPLTRTGDPTTEAMRAWNHPSGHAYALKNEALTGVWIALLLLVGFALWVRAARMPVFLSLCLLGIGIFTLGFEGRSRYLIIFVPLLLVLVACAIRALRRIRPSASSASGADPMTVGEVPSERTQ